MEKKLKNKVALITGASKGIGKAIALQFADEGASVIINYNNSKIEAEELVNLIKSKGGNALAIKANISKINEMEQMMGYVLKKYKKIDILVNNASVYPRKSFFESNEDDFDIITDTNIKGTYFCSKIFAKINRKKEAIIINIASNAGLVPKKERGLDYALSKAAVIHLTKSLALTLAPNIRVNCVAPGYTETEMVSFHNNPELKKSKEEQIPLKRVNSPQDIAKGVIFLASDDSRNITGQILIIDGGYNLK